jgi:hypothetical protein
MLLDSLLATYAQANVSPLAFQPAARGFGTEMKLVSLLPVQKHEVGDSAFGEVVPLNLTIKGGVEIPLSLSLSHAEEMAQHIQDGLERARLKAANLAPQ